MCFIYLAGCDLVPGGRGAPLSLRPMIQGQIGEEPVALLTFDGNKIMYARPEIVKKEGSRNKQVVNTSPLYIDKNSRFVNLAGEPILTGRGEEIYWNDKSMLITNSGRRLRKASQFLVLDKNLVKRPMRETEGIRLRMQSEGFMSSP